MLQIFVYDDTGASYELDLYKKEPLKLTISAEDLGDIPRVNSAYSKQFRVPATQTNSRIFQWWYEVNTVDFDITKRVKADLYSDGLFYKSGHIRIQNAYVNQTTSQVDLELVFFGETRDFASQVGEITLPELIGLTAYDHVLTLDYVHANWQAADAPVRYILADKGYTYDGNNPAGPVQNTIAITSWDNRFTQQNHPISLAQFTPMVQAKAIIDAIFEQTSYTYSADSFFHSDLFKKVYVDGIPNPSPFIAEDPALFEAHSSSVQSLSPFGSTDYIDFTNEINDPTNSYNELTSFFFPPVDANYSFEADVNLKIGRSVAEPTPEYRITISQGATLIADTGFVAVPFGVTAYRETVNVSGTAALLGFDGNANKLVSVQVQWQDTNGNNFVEPLNPAEDVPTRFECTAVSENAISVPSLLKYDIKSLDFLKSIITKFKLIMVPSVDNDSEFVIKPWKDYIGSGDRLDWTMKMDVSKDIQLRPIFFDQSQLIDLTDQRDEDHMNKPFQDEYNRAYGALQFDSQSDLLNNTRTVDTIFAPTPVNLVEGADETTSEFIIPFFSKLGDEVTTHNHLQHVPMRPKPRILFWNGIAPILGTEEWYYEGIQSVGDITPTQKSSSDAPLNGGYPRATPYSEFPTDNDTLNLNWFREVPLFPNGEAQLGESVYERYWNQYVKELYSPLSRVLTAYFNLNSQDLRIVSFNDIIFIKNAYYRVLKIYDAPITDLQTVKVDLVKILDTTIYANNGTPTPSGGGIDEVVVTGGGGGPMPGFDDIWGEDNNNFGDQDGTWGNPTVTEYYYIVQACDSPTGTYTAKHSAPLLIGDSVKMSGVIHVDICYQVVDVSNGPEDATVLEVFPDCLSCSE